MSAQTNIESGPGSCFCSALCQDTGSGRQTSSDVRCAEHSSSVPCVLFLCISRRMRRGKTENVVKGKKEGKDKERKRRMIRGKKKNDHQGKKEKNIKG